MLLELVTGVENRKEFKVYGKNLPRHKEKSLLPSVAEEKEDCVACENSFSETDL